MNNQYNDNILILDHVSYKYSPGTAYEVTALDDVSLNIKEGDYVVFVESEGDIVIRAGKLV